METEAIVTGQKDKGRGRAFRWPTVVAAILGLHVFAFVAVSPGDSAGVKKQARSARWIRVNYGDLVDPSSMTHSGNTVGSLQKKTARKKGADLPESDLVDLQPYLEPFSFVCNEIVATARPSQGKPYVSVADGYPPGSRQPAWAAMFREGHYQLFFGDGRARLFLKGDDPAVLFGRHQSVVRHPLLEILEKAGTDRITLEVYAFKNDYATRTLALDLNPFITTVTPDACLPKKRELSLKGLSDFFLQGPVLEAAEIDDNNDFYLYGGGPMGQTIAGRPVSLEDFAVVYRAVFHHGRSHPYISLDRSEDGRYAKVNFGGLLEDTRVGSVLLGADELFKTMITGIDPYTRIPVTEKIRTAVPDFRTVDERALFMDGPGSGTVRFWFYPDRIRTVTDGRIGLVESFQFTADEERRDGKGKAYRAGREAIDHLNRNFGKYAQVFQPFRELQTVGRMMAIAMWLRGTDARRRVDLDALLSVELSPRKTPGRVRKILAVTDGIRLSGGPSVEEHHKVYCLDEILERSDGATDDLTYVRKAKSQVERLGVETMLPGGSMRKLFVSGTRYTVASITGGIDLNPADFASPLTSPDSPLLARIRSARSSAAHTSAGGGASDRNALRRSTPLPRKTEAPSKAKQKKQSAAEDGASGKALSEEAGSWPRARKIVVTTSAYPAEIIVTGDPLKGETVVLKRGDMKKGLRSPVTP